MAETNNSGHKPLTTEARKVETTPITVEKVGRKYCAQFKSWYADTPSRTASVTIWGNSKQEVNEKVNAFLDN